MQLAALWAQESNRANSSADIRGDNYHLVKMIGGRLAALEDCVLTVPAKFFGDKHFDIAMPIIDQLCTDSDKFRQRAGAEMLLGYLRGSKHWSTESRRKLMRWAMDRLPTVFDLIKPDTRILWDSFFHVRLCNSYLMQLNLQTYSWYWWTVIHGDLNLC
jgi:proteasome activator subunit 4